MYLKYFKLWASKGRGNHEPLLIDFQDYSYGDAPLSPMYKPFFDVSAMSDWNLNHVNAYKAKIKIEDGDMANIEVDLNDENTGWFYDDFVATEYHQKIKEYESNKEKSEKIETKVELTDGKKSLHRSNKNNNDLDKVNYLSVLSSNRGMFRL